MNTKYFLLTVLCYWASLSSYLPSTTAHMLTKAPADEDNFDQNQDESLPKRLKALTLGENSELSTEEMLKDLLVSDSFAAVKKPTNKAGPKKNNAKNNKKPKNVGVVENGEDDSEEENEETETESEDDEEEEAKKEDTIVVGVFDDESDETSGTSIPSNTSSTSPPGDEDTDIKQVDAIITGNFEHYEIQACDMIKVPLNQQGIELKLNQIANTQKIMLTTSELTSCSQILDFACPTNAKFCQVQDLSEGSDLKLGEEVCYDNVAYLYLLPNNVAQSLGFELKVSITNDVQCKVVEEQGPSIDLNQYCQGLDSQQCQETVDSCASRCMWVTCKVNSQGQQQSQTSAYCAPTNTQRDSLQQTCSKSENFASATPENQIIEYPVCAVTNTEQSVEQSESGAHINLLKILGITFGVSLTLCIVFSCYYRYQFRTNKREICSPPECCPNFLFPRNSVQMESVMSVSRHTEQELGDYQPPVL